MDRTTIAALGVALTSLALWAAPQPASACGGFFCNRQGIDQSGENILFSINDDGTVTTVVQIQYQGPSETFAWILPVPAEPTVGVGTDAIFQQLAARTTPRFQWEQETVGDCRDEPRCWAYDDLENSPMRGGGFQDASAPAADAGPPAGVDVRLRAAVGPYDVAVLAAGSGDALRDWLGDNGYLIPAEASAELDHYVELEHFFVALKLLKDRDTGEIQPIVLRSTNDEPCIPIRLTRIATVPNMPITAYFLAEQRYRPFNFMLVRPDLDDVGLWTGETSYPQAVTRAVDDVGGHAFVTDYAGDVPSISLTLGSIEHLREVDDPRSFLMGLQGTGFTGDSQLMGILLRHVPPPEGVEARSFYNCLARSWCADYDAYLADLVFDPNALVDDLNEGIVEPREQAQAMLDEHGHLTRLFTTMSADEMDEDPMFSVSAELPREHSNVHTAIRRIHCGPEYFYWTAPVTAVLPSGHTERIREGVAYYGSDDEYCEDRMENGFYPGAADERLREIAASRNGALRGGGGACSASRGGGSLAGLAVALLGLLGFAWRRRR